MALAVLSSAEVGTCSVRAGSAEGDGAKRDVCTCICAGAVTCTGEIGAGVVGVFTDAVAGKSRGLGGAMKTRAGPPESLSGSVESSATSWDTVAPRAEYVTPEMISSLSAEDSCAQNL